MNATIHYQGETQHNHKLTKVKAKSATLKAAGNIEYYKCSVCQKLFTDAKGKKETTADKVKIAKLINISSATVTGISNKTYTGKALTQSPKVVLNKKTLKNGTDYSLTYKNNKNAGKATVTITGIGKYGGSVSKTFTIAKAANPMALKVTSKSFKQLKLKKATTFDIGVSKAQGKVTYSLDKKASKAGIKVNSGGTVTIPKKCGKGTYTITVKAAGKGSYNAGSKTVTITVK